MKVAHCKIHVFVFQNWAPHFYIVFFYLLRDVQKHVMGPGAYLRVWEVKMALQALLRIRNAHFAVGRCCLCVVLPVSVEDAMNCQMRVNDVFCAVSLSGTMRSAISVLLERSGNASFKPTDPS